MCEDATSLMGRFSSSPVTVFKTVTKRVIPQILNISFISSLYFCDDINGNKRPFVSTSLYLSTNIFARSFSGTRTITGCSCFMWNVFYCSIDNIIGSHFQQIRNPAAY